ncbi:hypothetical protein PR202_gb23952 [Eleusine coracana subsp. coracana]|uniref:Carbohydrate kinase PfkB domain-containing protein n=1 Tax=Eleusine coracana subsp. coracana TaxID=191504 RepID=A0AAV5FHJ4_ELECO|nr:hypothetical protein PR202_gb23952 [Eleusine coracana subsp. coracana]
MAVAPGGGSSNEAWRLGPIEAPAQSIEAKGRPIEVVAQPVDVDSSSFLIHLFLLLSLCQSNLRISADGVGSISGRLLLGTAEVIPPEELIDTTGAGDAFIGAVLYGQYATCPF